MTSRRAIVIGEALVDLVPGDDGQYRPLPGGSAANVAVSLARLGVPTSMLARLGTGPFGHIVRRHLTSNDVSLDLAVEAGEPVSLAVVTLDDDGAATYDFYAEGTSDWGWTDTELATALPSDTADDVGVLIAGSIAVFRPPGADAIERLLATATVPVVVDPNIRPSLIGTPAEVRARCARLLAHVDVVKVSDEDLAWLEPSAKPADIAAEWVQLGPSLVVVTQGADGAFATTSAGLRVDVDALSIDVIDTVGAGDAFTAGLVAALLGADSLAEPTEAELRHALGRASLTAAITCSRHGADPPTMADVYAAESD